ncbi:hypothetical protein, partial [endosymbiont of Ridgeia piscesae]|uniref:hypothetical protein n=1 Tax=endosymbiont of Ridgeia piscesae TaxID=54398 RepID=UPI0013052A6C
EAIRTAVKASLDQRLGKGIEAQKQDDDEEQFSGSEPVEGVFPYHFFMPLKRKWILLLATDCQFFVNAINTILLHLPGT